MSDLIAFLKNREADKVVEYAACKDWKDEKGNPVKWKFKKLHTKELNEIRSANARINRKKKDVDVDDVGLTNSILVASIVYPNLKDAKLADLLFPDAPLDQRTPENVLMAILCDDREYQKVWEFVAKLHNWQEEQGEDDSALVEIAKNE